MDDKFYNVLSAWNKKKTIKGFIALHKHGFTRFTVKDLFGWRTYRILKNTVSGRYKEVEKILEKERLNLD